MEAYPPRRRCLAPRFERGLSGGPLGARRPRGRPLGSGGQVFQPTRSPRLAAAGRDLSRRDRSNWVAGKKGRCARLGAARCRVLVAALAVAGGQRLLAEHGAKRRLQHRCVVDPRDNCLVGRRGWADGPGVVGPAAGAGAEAASIAIVAGHVRHAGSHRHDCLVGLADHRPTAGRAHRDAGRLRRRGGGVAAGKRSRIGRGAAAGRLRWGTGDRPVSV